MVLPSVVLVNQILPPSVSKDASEETNKTQVTTSQIYLNPLTKISSCLKILEIHTKKHPYKIQEHTLKSTHATN